jgi:hypothetical protein
MATIDQRQRYIRQAELCYEIARTMSGAKAKSMSRLGDTYSDLANNSDRFQQNLFIPNTKGEQPECKRCGNIMTLTHSLPRTELMSAIQSFRCDQCEETLIWQSKMRPSVKQPSGSPPSGQTVTRYVALSFTRADGKTFAPAKTIECSSERGAVLRAELLSLDEENAGSVAFSRRENLELGNFEPAVVLRVFGDVPDNFNID